MADFNGKFFDGGSNYLIKKLHLEKGGAVQTKIDGLCITYMQPYIPFQSGALASAFGMTQLGSGEIIQDTPYARYQYYGQLYVDPITKKGAFYNKEYGFWSRPGVNKIPSDRKLTYNTSINPQAGQKWFERMKADHKADILQEVSKIAKGDL